MLRGGVLSPPLWLLRLNGVAEVAKKGLVKEINFPESDRDTVLQIFADDTSAATAPKDVEKLIKIAENVETFRARFLWN